MIKNINSLCQKLLPDSKGSRMECVPALKQLRKKARSWIDLVKPCNFTLKKMSALGPFCNSIVEINLSKWKQGNNRKDRITTQRHKYVFEGSLKTDGGLLPFQRLAK